MIQKLFMAAAYVVLAIVCFATLSPIELRPGTGAVGFERFAAFALMGALFGLAFPKRHGRVAVFVVGLAFGLEALQLLVPSRHGELAEAVLKAIGGLAGVTFSMVMLLLYRSGSSGYPNK